MYPSSKHGNNLNALGNRLNTGLRAPTGYKQPASRQNNNAENNMQITD